MIIKYLKKDHWLSEILHTKRKTENKNVIKISKYHSVTIIIMVNILASAQGTYFYVGVSTFRRLDPVICTICRMEIHAKWYIIVWLIAQRISLTCMSAPDTRNTLLSGPSLHFVRRALWNLSDDMRASVFTNPKPSWTGTLAEISCHVLLLPALLLMFANRHW